MQSIGNRIKTKRKELNLTIKQIHENTGLSIGNISDIENDKYAPSIASLLPLSQILKCSIDWIITGTNTPQQIQITENECSHILSATEISIIDMFRDLDERDKEDIYDCLTLKYNRAIKRGKTTSYNSPYTGKNDSKKSDPDDHNSSSGIA
ncbi:MAG TPA: XRE family transcriptional regulator [Lachnospiraceae bacterium]|nr:XRE family transcriptional regulator [Lachnospiraceae bacterium]